MLLGPKVLCRVVNLAPLVLCILFFHTICGDQTNPLTAFHICSFEDKITLG